MKKIIISVIVLFFCFITVAYFTGWLDLLTSKEEGNVFTIKEINLEMIRCPAGSFKMGSPEEEHSKVKNMVADFHKDSLGFEYNEKLHLVTITKPFYIGKFEVTQSQYEIVMGKNPSVFKNPNKPVEMVSWEDAKVFCDKLNYRYLKILPKGYKFALPTEAQWEYACRAGTNTPFNNNSNKNIDEVAWYCDNAKGTTHIVGEKKPNAWGIYDMHGNVAEWCKDLYGEYPNEDVRDPTGVSSSSYRVCRGGGWYAKEVLYRSACRLFDPPSDKIDFLGFRVALVPIL